MAEIMRKLDALGKQIEEHQADDERRFDHIDETLKDVREIRDAKKTLARVLTIMTERVKNAK